MREDIESFNLAGVRCSASVVAIDVVHQIFKTLKNSIGVVVSTQNLGAHWYCGKENDKMMMFANCLFLSGGCSMLFTNKPTLKNRAILKLKHIERTHYGSNDEAYNCCIQVEDDQGYSGFRLNKSLVKSAAQALTVNLQVMAPKILPLWELVRFFTAFVGNSIMKKNTFNDVLGSGGLNFMSGIEHFCVHPGGRAVIDGVGKGLSLNFVRLDFSKMVF